MEGSAPRSSRSKIKNQKLKIKVIIQNSKILIIDTSDSEKTVVGLEIEGKKHIIKGKSKILKAQNVLPLIEKILKKYKLKPNDLTAIKVNTGPGSFTGLRVGVAVANTLAWALKIPVNGKSQVIPRYKFDN